MGGNFECEKRNCSRIKECFEKCRQKTNCKNISLITFRGEVFGLLGANGAGKTTIMRLITSLIKPSSGTIHINNINMCKNYDKALEHVGAIIEAPELYKHLSGRLNLKIMANMYKNKIDKKYIEEVIHIAGLTDRIDDKVKEYSLGMRQRLGIAASLLNKPNILILDEPSNGLDPAGIKELRTMLRNFANKGVCVIISSHLLSELEMMCDRFAIINKGEHIETKSINDLNNKTLKYEYNLYKSSEIDKLQKMIKTVGVKLEEISHDKFVVLCNNKQNSQLIDDLVKNDVKIISVIPQKRSLEDYFVERTAVNGANNTINSK